MSDEEAQTRLEAFRLGWRGQQPRRASDYWMARHNNFIMRWAPLAPLSVNVAFIVVSILDRNWLGLEVQAFLAVLVLSAWSLGLVARGRMLTYFAELDRRLAEITAPEAVRFPPLLTITQPDVDPRDD